MKNNILLISLLAMASSSACFAANADWTGGSGSGFWNDNGNWSAAFPTTANIATFNSTVSNSTVSMNGTAISLASITFTTNAGSHIFNAGGGSLTLAALSLNANLAGAVTQTFNLPLSLLATTTITNNSTIASLNLVGGVDNIGADARLVNFRGAGITTVTSLTQSGGFALNINKDNSGKVILTGASTSTGVSTLAGGVVQVNNASALPTGQIQYSGGILGLGAGDLTRALGTATNQMRWISGGGGGFAAYGADRTVNIGGANATFTWGTTPSFIQTGQTLIFGSSDSTNKLTYSNGLGLGNATRTILVNDGNSTTNVDAEMTGVISGALGGIDKTGTGTLSLTRDNTYTGDTIVSSGTLLINGNQTAANGNVSVASGATLGGNGTIGGATTITGILAPGNSIGTLNISANATWQGAATAGSSTDWKFELGAGNTADLLNITGDFLKDSSLGENFRFDFMGSTATGTFKLVDWSGTTGFSAGNFTYTPLGGGNTGTFAINGSQLDFTVIPEPGTWALVGLGLVFAVFSSRRSRKATHLMR